MGMLARFLLGSLFGIVWAVALMGTDERECSEEDRPKYPRYRALLPNYILPIFVGFLAVAGPVVRGGAWTFETMLTAFFVVFAHIGAYYLVLCLFLPLLRRYISARVCAALWLLPNYLYMMVQEAYEVPNPVFVLYLPDGVIGVLSVVWAAGFLGVLGWKFVSHFRFRRHLLQYAREEEDSAVLELWEKEQRRAGYPEKRFTLVRSPQTSTPLTIGFFRSTIRVVLPERDYTPEELRLIFRHELVHIGREDSATKFFLVFCTAMCWFNPLMWWAMRKSAEDLELSCDETVLLTANGRTRKQYAELILTTAGDERGFTTCLSASAKSLRYRLRHIIAPRKRAMGALLGGGIFCLLLMTCGYTALAYETVPGTEAVFGGNDVSEYVVTVAGWKKGTGYGVETCAIRDGTALRDYLAELDFYQVTGHYSFDPGERCLNLRCKSPEGLTILDLTDKGLTVYRPEGRGLGKFQYACRDVDWDYLRSLLSLR